jgi:hypothetical protein
MLGEDRVADWSPNGGWECAAPYRLVDEAQMEFVRFDLSRGLDGVRARYRMRFSEDHSLFGSAVTSEIVIEFNSGIGCHCPTSCICVRTRRRSNATSEDRARDHRAFAVAPHCDPVDHARTRGDHRACAALRRTPSAAEVRRLVYGVRHIGSPAFRRQDRDFFGPGDRGFGDAVTSVAIALGEHFRSDPKG